MKGGCFHECEVCSGVYTHHPKCETVFDGDLCALCIAEGYAIAWCPACESTQPIQKLQYICDKCLVPKVRIA